MVTSDLIVSVSIIPKDGGNMYVLHFYLSSSRDGAVPYLYLLLERCRIFSDLFYLGMYCRIKNIVEIWRYLICYFNTDKNHICCLYHSK